MNSEEEPIVITRTYINYKYMREFTDNDFDLNSKTLINLKVDNELNSKTLKDTNVDNEINASPYFILFMAETNNISKRYLNTWLELAKLVKNDKCHLGFCNLDFENGVFTNFKKLREKDYIDHPFYWARFIETPFMMVYRGGWPQGFYNDSINLQKLNEYCNDYVSYYGYNVPKEHSLRPELIPGEYTRQAKYLQDQKTNTNRIEEKPVDFKTQLIANAVNF
jgi:hypothetical protein